MKKALKILTSCIILIALYLSICLIRYTGQDQCGIVGNRIATNAPIFLIYMINGAPDNVDTLADTPEKIYTYNNATLFGKENSRISYYVSLFRAFEIKAEIPVNESEKDLLLETASRHLHDQYQYLNGFYRKDIKDENGTVIGQQIGSNLGPPFISAQAYMSDDRIYITIDDLR